MQNLGVGRTARSVAAARYHTCAVLDDRSVKCWGAVPPSLENCLTPNTLTVGVGRYAEKLSVGKGPLRGSRRLIYQVRWGKLQRPAWWRTQTDKAIATTVLISAERSALDVSVGWASTCAVLVDLSLVCWGEIHGVECCGESSSRLRIMSVLQLAGSQLNQGKSLNPQQHP